MIDHLLRDPCTIHRRSTSVDEWGEPGTAISASTETTCYFEQTDATEVVVGQETYWSDGRVFLPRDADLDAASWLEVDGAMYEVVGRPATHKRPDLSVSHITVAVREVTSS